MIRLSLVTVFLLLAFFKSAIANLHYSIYTKDSVLFSIEVLPDYKIKSGDTITMHISITNKSYDTVFIFDLNSYPYYSKIREISDNYCYIPLGGEWRYTQGYQQPPLKLVILNKDSSINFDLNFFCSPNFNGTQEFKHFVGNYLNLKRVFIIELEFGYFKNTRKIGIKRENINDNIFYFNYELDYYYFEWILSRVFLPFSFHLMK